MRKLAYILSFILFIGAINVQGASLTYFEECPLDNPYHVLINKDHPLSPNYKPSNLVMPKVTFQTPGNIEKNYMEATAAAALEKMFAAAKADGMRLVAASGYRSYSRQTTLYNNAIRTYGKNQKSSAKPGESEHQSGLAMDLNSVSQSFAYTKEGQWVAKNAHLYGFIVRYPKNKTHITGYIYEPWHIRYVGTELATYCYTNNLTLEELESCCQKYEEGEMYVSSPDKLTPVLYPIIRQEGVTYIKLRDLIGNIGGSIDFEKNVLTVNANGHQLILSEDSNYVKLDDSPQTITSTPIRINNSIYVPMRATLALLGFDLYLINGTTLIISKAPILNTDAPVPLVEETSTT